MPNDPTRPANQDDLTLTGVGGSGSGAASEVAKQDFSGSYGYVME